VGCNLRIAELFVDIKLGVETDKWLRFNTGVTALGTAFTGVKNIIDDAIKGLSDFMGKTVDTVNGLQQMNHLLGLNTKEIQKWQLAGQLSGIGVTAQGVSQGISGLTKNLALLRLGMGNVQGWNLLGISALGSNDPIQMMDKIVARYKQLKPGSDEMARFEQAIQMLGGNDDVLAAIQTMASGDKFSNVYKNLILSQSDLNKVTEANKQFVLFGLTLDNLRNKVMAGIAPDLTKMFTAVNTYLVSHLPEIIKFIDGIIKSIINLFEHPEKIKLFIGKINDYFKSLNITGIVDNIKKISSEMNKLEILPTFIKGIRVALDLLNASLETTLSLLKGINVIKKDWSELQHNPKENQHGVAISPETIASILGGIGALALTALTGGADLVPALAIGAAGAVAGNSTYNYYHNNNTTNHVDVKTTGNIDGDSISRLPKEMNSARLQQSGRIH